MRYAPVRELQEECVRRRLAGTLADTLFLLQHAPVITMGRRARSEHLVSPPGDRVACGIEVEPSPRGGDVTYHGPGQWVLYPILRLEGADADLPAYVRRLEEIAIRTAGDFGVTAFRRPGLAGVWTAAGKIAAVGVRVTRWVTSHGMSFNADVDLEGFRHIVPCGLRGEAVASLASVLGAKAPARSAVAGRLLAHAAGVFGRRVEVVAPGEWGIEPPLALPGIRVASRGTGRYTSAA